MRYFRNTVAVLVAVGLTTVALYAGVQTTSGSAAADSIGTTVVLSYQTYMCPLTGCSTSSCHVVTDILAKPAKDGIRVCPDTGCTASTCHGATGAPPPKTDASEGTGGAQTDSG